MQAQGLVSYLDALDERRARLLVLGLLVGITLVVFWDFLTLQKVFLYKDIGSDSVNASYPYMMLTHRYLHTWGIPFWAFEMGMGQNVFTLGLSDPFDVFLYLTSSKTIPYLLGYKEAAKLVLCGWVFYRYLSLFSLGLPARIMGSLMFAFCGFTVVGTGWFLFSFESFTVALLLWGFERQFRFGYGGILVTAVFLLGVSRPFNMALYAPFMAVYAAYRYSMKHDDWEWKNVFLFFWGIGKTALLGVLLSAPFLLEHLQMMLNSPRGTGEYAYHKILSGTSIFSLIEEEQFGTAVLRWLSADLLGSGSAYKGWSNILEAPVFYAGIPAILLAPQVFFALPQRQKRWFAFFSLAAILPLFFPYFRRLFWLFTGDYYRSYSLLVALLCILFSVLALDKLLKMGALKPVRLILTVCLFLFFTYYPFFNTVDALDSAQAFMVRSFLILYCVLLYQIHKKGKAIWFYCFLGLFYVEMTVFSSTTINNRMTMDSKEWTQRTGYNDYTKEALDIINQTEKSLFYRVDKTYSSTPSIHIGLNDAMVQNYKSTPSYHPFNSIEYVSYLSSYDIIAPGDEISSRWALGLANRPLLQGLNAVRYLLAKSIPDSSIFQTHDLVAQAGDVMVFKHRYALPFGFCYDKIVSLQEFKQFSSIQKDFLSHIAAVVSDEEQYHFSELDRVNQADADKVINNFTWEDYEKQWRHLRQDTFQIISFNPNEISGQITLRQPRLLYFSLPWDKGWTVYNQNQMELPVYKIAGGMTGVLLPSGRHQLTLSYRSGGFYRGMWLFFAVALFLANDYRKKRRKQLEKYKTG